MKLTINIRELFEANAEHELYPQPEGRRHGRIDVSVERYTLGANLIIARE